MYEIESQSVTLRASDVLIEEKLRDRIIFGNDKSDSDKKIEIKEIFEVFQSDCNQFSYKFDCNKNDKKFKMTDFNEKITKLKSCNFNQNQNKSKNDQTDIFVSENKSTTANLNLFHFIYHSIFHFIFSYHCF